jgi:hypothetical protein
MQAAKLEAERTPRIFGLLHIWLWSPAAPLDCWVESSQMVDD